MCEDKHGHVCVCVCVCVCVVMCVCVWEGRVDTEHMESDVDVGDDNNYNHQTSHACKQRRTTQTI